MPSPTLDADGPRTVHVEHVMGTVFSIDIRDQGPWDGAITEVVQWLHRVDAVFSTYRADSDISRIRRGELVPGDADPAVAVVLALCAQVQAETDGYFSMRPYGELDPTGLVKGWAVEYASALLRSRGARNHAVNGGGDVQLAGRPAPDQPWSVGIADPHDRTRVCAVVTGGDRAVATSGNAERGTHIVDPTSGRAADELASATVIGPSLTRADCYATAAFAMGPAALDWIVSRDGYAALLVTRDGELLHSAGWPPERV